MALCTRNTLDATHTRVHMRQTAHNEVTMCQIHVISAINDEAIRLNGGFANRDEAQLWDTEGT